MHIVEIIPHRHYRHESGRTASFYGSAPHGAGWTVAADGWSVRTSEGTIGPFGRVPFPTESEAREWANRMNGRRKLQLQDHAVAWPEMAPKIARLIAEIPSF